MESLICRGEKEMRGESTLNEKNTMEQGFVITNASGYLKKESQMFLFYKSHIKNILFCEIHLQLDKNICE
jgi:hypothetical protein